MTASWRNAVPWWGKVAIKLALSRLPLDRFALRRLGIFRHGEMDDPAHAIEVLRGHHALWQRVGAPRPGFVMLELGPGDGLLSGVVARAFGAARSYLVDSHDHANRDVEPFRRMAAALTVMGMDVPALPPRASIEAALTLYGIHYLTRGIDSLRALPDASVDYCWSQAVLEHVRRRDYLAILAQLRRLTRPQGLGTHVVDLRDHLGGSLNNLRFPDWFWENDRVAASGFYTNRLQLADHLRAFAEAGFSVDIVRADRWERLPLPRRALAAPFAALAEGDLLTRGFSAVLRPLLRHPSE